MRSNEISIGDALKAFINKSRMKPGLNETRIRECWEKLMGKAIARYTENIQVIDHKLIITTNVARSSRNSPIPNPRSSSC